MRSLEAFSQSWRHRTGFKNDNYSHGMATTFLLAFSPHFMLLGILTIRMRKAGRT